MNKSNVTKALKSVERFVTKRSPEILMSLGIAGGFTTVVLAVKETPRALKLIEAEKKERHCDELPPIDIVKTCWKCYIPAMISGVVSTACVVGSHSVSASRMAALTAAYQISETALAEYKEKVVETIGEKKEQAVRDKIDKDFIEKNPVRDDDVILTGHGNTLCLDSLSGRYFRSDIDRIKKAVNELNRRMTYDVYVSLNEFYDELDLSHTILGDTMGWNLDGGLIEVDFGSQLTEKDEPCAVVRFHHPPKYDFSNLY